MTASDPAELWFDDTRVARVDGLYSSDGTSYGTATLLVRCDQGGQQTKLCEFVAFSVDWNRRAEESPENPPDPDEFLRFGDFLQTGRWTMRRNGVVNVIRDAPVFFGEDEVSFFVAL